MAPPSSLHRNPQMFPASNHSCTPFLFKLTVLSVLLLATLPRFTTSSPEPSTALTHFWELLHLLLVGIAVSYGLFSRKVSHFPVSHETHISVSDLSTMFHDSSDGSDLRASSFQQRNPDGFQNPFGYAETNVKHAWNSQYNQTQSVVVVAAGYKSLGLPVRSLKSTVSDSHGTGPTRLERLSCDSDRALPSPISWRSRSGRMEVTGKASNDGARVRPLSVDETQLHFQSKASSFSPTTPHAIPSSAASKPPLSSFSSSVSSELSSSKMEDLRYKHTETGNAAHSGSVSFEFSDLKMDDLRFKMESREEIVSVTGHAHFRPPSIDETECESPKSESPRSDASFPSNASSLYPSSNNHSPSQSISSEFTDSNIQKSSSGRIRMRKQLCDFESLKSRPFRSKPSYSPRTRLKSFPPDNQSPPCSLPSESPGSRIGMLQNVKSFHRSSPTNDEPPSNKSSNRKPAAPRKAWSRGKSVRTIRQSSRYSTDAALRSQTDDKSRKSLNEYKAVERIGSRMVDRRYGNPPRNLIKQKHDEKDNVGWKLDGESEEDVDGKNPESSEEEAGEVDKKADEFIAKFREQIRLQKTASIDVSGELNIQHNYFT